jgi:hypothetical protein
VGQEYGFFETWHLYPDKTETLTFTAQSNFDNLLMLVEVLSATTDQVSIRHIAQNDDSSAGSTQASVSAMLAAGTDYFLRVSGFNEDETGQYTITITRPAQLPTPPETGSIRINVTSTGPAPADFTVTLNAHKAKTVAANGNVTYSNILTGQYDVELSDLGACTVNGNNPQTVTVTADQTASVNFSVTCAPPVNTIFSEDFEGGLGLWSPDNGIWEVGLPTSGPNECHAGVQCAGTVLDGDYPFNSSSLVSPTITLPAIGASEELHLRFWHWFSFGSATGGNPDRGVVFIQEQISPGVWSASTELARYQLSSGGAWTLPLVDLSAYGGKSVRILFDMQGSHALTSSSGWYIDDVSIEIN